MIGYEFFDSLKRETNIAVTENGAIGRKTTLSAVYDLFAFGGSYRNRTDEDCILLFKKALEEDEAKAMKCLFWIRDVRGGAGERRFFRVCYNWLAKTYPEIAKRNLEYIPEYGRWDDLYCLMDTVAEKRTFKFIDRQLKEDLKSLKDGGKYEGVSLLGKWLMSENASAKKTKKLGNRTRIALNLTHKEYRKMLSALRTRINIVEKLMSEKRWEEIQFDKIPSKAGLIYRNAFAHNDIIGARYEEFINDKNSKVKARALFPYEIIKEARSGISYWGDEYNTPGATDRKVLEKYWNNLPDYLNGQDCNMLCVVDTSGSMTSAYYNTKTAPIDVAISLGMYCGERIGEPFKNHFISFSHHPELIEIEGVDFVDKVTRIYRQNLCENTDLKAVFDLIKDIALENNLTQEQIPETLVVISDMEIDYGSYWKDKTHIQSDMEKLEIEWNKAGLRFPKLVYWNVNAKQNLILQDPNPYITYVSGCSPTIFKNILAGKSGIDFMNDILGSERYEKIS